MKKLTPDDWFAIRDAIYVKLEEHERDFTSGDNDDLETVQRIVSHAMQPYKAKPGDKEFCEDCECWLAHYSPDGDGPYSGCFHPAHVPRWSRADDEWWLHGPPPKTCPTGRWEGCENIR